MLSKLLEGLSDCAIALLLILATAIILALLISGVKKYQSTFDKGVENYLGRSNPLPGGK